MFLGLLLRLLWYPVALAASDEASEGSHRKIQLFVIPVETQQSRMSQQIRPIAE